MPRRTAFLVLYIITHPKFSRSPLHTKRPLTLTEHNTLLNRQENGGTGVWSRKWRRKVATALAMAPLRRGLGEPGSDYEDGLFGDDDDYLSSGSEFWKVKVKPPPAGLKGCLKREGSFEVTKQMVRDDSAGAVAAHEKPRPPNTLSPIPSPAVSVSSSDGDNSFYSPSISEARTSPPPRYDEAVIEAGDPAAPGARKPSKFVSIQEPSLVELEALRELWDSPEMQSTVNGGNGLGGIAGYRRTRDHYARGQGGRGLNKAAAPVAATAAAPNTSALPSGKVVESHRADSVAKASEKDKPRGVDDEGSPRSRRPLNAGLSRTSSSLSPSPITRRPVAKRALSPNQTGIVVASSTTSRRRGLSPNPGTGTLAGTSPLRSSSTSPGPSTSSLDRAQPRWIKTKKTAKGMVQTQFPARGTRVGEDEEDDGDARDSNRAGTMSATVSDDEDEDGYEDVPPTPPSQPSLTLAMAPITSSSEPLNGDPSPATSSRISPSLELLLDHTNRCLGERDRNGSVDASFAQPAPPSDDTVRPPETPSFSVTPASPENHLVPLPPVQFTREADEPGNEPLR